MKDEIEVMMYYMAAEKAQNMINTIESALEFFDEFKIKPDDEVRKAMAPVVAKLKGWADGN